MEARRTETRVATALLFLLMLQAGEGLEASGSDMAIDILYFGDAFFYSTGAVPYTHLREEPAFRLSAIPTWSLEEMRARRHYLPRTYEHHVSEYDVVLMSDATRYVFEPQLLEWFKLGVIQDGQGFLMVGGLNSFGGGKGALSWGGSAIEEVLPCQCLDQQFHENRGLLFPVPVDPDDEFCTALPFEEAKAFTGMNTVEPKQGSTEILRPVVSIGTVRGPLLLSWKLGEGIGLAHTPDLTYAWVGYFGDWEYYGDYCINLIYHLAQQGIPQDITLVHAARTAMLNYAVEKTLLVEMAEFVGRFGANPRKIEEGIADVVEMKGEADAQYLDQNFVEVLSTLDEIRARVRQLGEEATRLKNAALLWVFMAEWLVVTATLMITGYVVWSLMIQRRLYRDIRPTRFSEGGRQRL
jgi:uncharacterized membrane protein